jgi:hypothetical protein
MPLFLWTSLQQQQQQQHSLLSQASWGRLEMKPKRDEKQGDTDLLQPKIFWTIPILWTSLAGKNLLDYPNFGLEPNCNQM